jgi:hypothetical protein
MHKERGCVPRSGISRSTFELLRLVYNTAAHLQQLQLTFNPGVAGYLHEGAHTIYWLVHPFRPLLAAGLARGDSPANRLAPVSPAAPDRHHHKCRLCPDSRDIVSPGPAARCETSLKAMERRKEGNGLETFLEHWGLTISMLIIAAGAQFFLFFTNLTGKPWIYFCLAGMAMQVIGAALILYAKFPVYRSGQFFTFGVKSIPEHLARFYRWGWRIFLFGVVLSLCLLLSKR